MGGTRLIVIAGPTAVGKTPVAIALAQQIPAEIICADSRTLYRGMDIGTAKPTAQERDRVPYHLLDIARPDEVVTLATYQRLALEAVEAIRARGCLPLLVGGTGLYIRAVVDALRIPPAAPDWHLRAVLEAEERAGGRGTLHRRLGEVDPAAAARIHPHNVRRIIRALEVHAQTGVPISVLQLSSPQRPSPGSPHRGPGVGGDVLMIALSTDRARLYERIHRRIDRYLAAGLVDEVRRLLAAGYAKTLPALQGLGYKEVIPHVEGTLSLSESRALLQRNTRRYAKRQVTWFRGDGRYVWLEAGDDQPEVVAAQIRALVLERTETHDFPGGSGSGC
jgi:tRNA dimethylallyltransferase